MGTNSAHMDPDATQDIEIALDTKTLLKELRRAYPPRCIMYGKDGAEDPIAAHRYAAKVELIGELIAWYEEQEGRTID